MFLVAPMGDNGDYKIRLLRKREVPKFEPLFPRDGLILRNGPQQRDMLHFLCALLPGSRAPCMPEGGADGWKACAGRRERWPGTGSHQRRAFGVPRPGLCEPHHQDAAVDAGRPGPDVRRRRVTISWSKRCVYIDSGTMPRHWHDKLTLLWEKK